MEIRRTLWPAHGRALLLAALLLLVQLIPRTAQAFIILPGQRNIAIAETDLRNGKLSTLLFDMALLNGGFKVFLNTAFAIGRPSTAYDFRLDIAQIVEYTPAFLGQVFDPAVNPVVKSYPANGQWAWQPFVQVSPPEAYPRIFQSSTTDWVFTALLTVDPQPGLPLGFSDIKFDITLNYPLLNVAPGNNLAFVGNVASTLQYDNLIDRQGRNVYNCAGQPCFGPNWETTLTCNDGPIVDVITKLPSIVSPGKVKVTAAQKVWTLDFTEVQDNPPPNICVWD